jgi:hypothetical protein
MKINKILFITACLSLLVAGCLGYEEECLFLDISQKVGEVRYTNIVSDEGDEAKIEEDFQALIEMAYDDRHHEEGAGETTINIISRELYGIGPRLNGRVKFSFEDLKSALNELNIEIKDNEYVHEIGVDEAYRGGNGTYSEHNGTKVVKWDKQIKSIELKKRSASFDHTKNTGLLPYWLQWKNSRNRQ